jgi:hypothetical protein
MHWSDEGIEKINKVQYDYFSLPNSIAFQKNHLVGVHYHYEGNVMIK